MDTPAIIVISGGETSERDISLLSGRSVSSVLEKAGMGSECVLDANTIPEDLDPEAAILFPLIHGEYGEDGRFQSEAEEKGFSYVGCGPESSRLCIDKVETRKLAERLGIPVSRGWSEGSADELPDDDEIPDLGLIVKPRKAGSSVGLRKVSKSQDLRAAIAECESDWLVEECFPGTDCTIGILGEESVGSVAMYPASGIYDYEHKYTSGMTRYEAPASFPQPVLHDLAEAARAIFLEAGCRDFGRVDFLFDESTNNWVFLELNTLPGMTETSLLPMCARQQGLSFPDLVQRMIHPAIERFHNLKRV